MATNNNTDNTDSNKKPLSISLSNNRSYDIIIEHDILKQSGSYIKKVLKGNTAILVSDENVSPLYAEIVQNSLRAEGIKNHLITVKVGEDSKSFATLQDVCEQALELGVDRASTLIALGGGVVGDLVGLASSLLMRGTGFIQIPTTILSQVDSSVGGKTAINLKSGKNLVGTFYQPQLVLIDPQVLTTLTERHKLSGYAEVIKYGLIDDMDFFTDLADNHMAERMISGDIQAQIKAITKSCTAKATIVEQDEQEHGVRALLNLGHTFAHVLEAITGFGDKLYHGEAVSIGICMAFDISTDLGLCPVADTNRVKDHLKTMGMPTDCSNLGINIKDKEFSTDNLMKIMRKDKKNSDSKITLILVKGISQAFVHKTVDEKHIVKVWQSYGFPQP